MTYLDRYRGMTDEELVDWSQALFDKVALFPEGTAGLIERRNIAPFIIERLRKRIKDDPGAAPSRPVNPGPTLFDS